MVHYLRDIVARSMEHPEWVNKKDKLHVDLPIDGYERRKIRGESWADVAVRLSEILTSDRFHRVQHDRLAERDRQHFWDQLKAVALRLFDASSKERKDHAELRDKLDDTRLELERVRAELERAETGSQRGKAGQGNDKGNGTASAAGVVGQEVLQKCLAEKEDVEKSRDGWVRSYGSLKKDHDAAVAKLSTLQQQYSQDIPTLQKKLHDEYDEAVEALKRQFAAEVEKSSQQCAEELTHLKKEHAESAQLAGDLEKTCAKDRADLAECRRAYAAGSAQAAASLASCQQAGRDVEARLVASRDESAANKVALESCARSKAQLEKQLAQLRTRHAREIEDIERADGTHHEELAGCRRAGEELKRRLENGEEAMRQLREQQAQEIARLKREHEESFVRTTKNLKDTYSQAAGYDKTQLADCISARSDLDKVVSALKAMYKHPQGALAALQESRSKPGSMVRRAIQEAERVQIPDFSMTELVASLEIVPNVREAVRCWDDVMRVANLLVETPVANRSPGSRAEYMNDKMHELRDSDIDQLFEPIRQLMLSTKAIVDLYRQFWNIITVSKQPAELKKLVTEWLDEGGKNQLTDEDAEWLRELVDTPDPLCDPIRIIADGLLETPQPLTMDATKSIMATIRRQREGLVEPEGEMEANGAAPQDENRKALKLYEFLDDLCGAFGVMTELTESKPDLISASANVQSMSGEAIRERAWMMIRRTKMLRAFADLRHDIPTNAERDSGSLRRIHDESGLLLAYDADDIDVRRWPEYGKFGEFIGRVKDACGEAPGLYVNSISDVLRDSGRADRGKVMATFGVGAARTFEMVVYRCSLPRDFAKAVVDRPARFLELAAEALTETGNAMRPPKINRTPDDDTTLRNLAVDLARNDLPYFERCRKLAEVLKTAKDTLTTPRSNLLGDYVRIFAEQTSAAQHPMTGNDVDSLLDLIRSQLSRLVDESKSAANGGADIQTLEKAYRFYALLNDLFCVTKAVRALGEMNVDFDDVNRHVESMTSGSFVRGIITLVAHRMTPLFALAELEKRPHSAAEADRGALYRISAEGEFLLQHTKPRPNLPLVTPPPRWPEAESFAEFLTAVKEACDDALLLYEDSFQYITTRNSRFIRTDDVNRVFGRESAGEFARFSGLYMNARIFVRSIADSTSIEFLQDASKALHEPGSVESMTVDGESEIMTALRGLAEELITRDPEHLAGLRKLVDAQKTRVALHRYIRSLGEADSLCSLFAPDAPIGAERDLVNAFALETAPAIRRLETSIRGLCEESKDVVADPIPDVSTLNTIFDTSGAPNGNACNAIIANPPDHLEDFAVRLKAFGTWMDAVRKNISQAGIRLGCSQLGATSDVGGAASALSECATSITDAFGTIGAPGLDQAFTQCQALVRRLCAGAPEQTLERATERVTHLYDATGSTRIDSITLEFGGLKEDLRLLLSAAANYGYDVKQCTENTRPGTCAARILIEKSGRWKAFKEMANALNKTFTVVGTYSAEGIIALEQLAEETSASIPPFGKAFTSLVRRIELNRDLVRADDEKLIRLRDELYEPPEGWKDEKLVDRTHIDLLISAAERAKNACRRRLPTGPKGGVLQLALDIPDGVSSPGDAPSCPELVRLVCGEDRDATHAQTIVAELLHRAQKNKVADVSVLLADHRDEKAVLDAMIHYANGASTQARVVATTARGKSGAEALQRIFATTDLIAQNIHSAYTTLFVEKTQPAPAARPQPKIVELNQDSRSIYDDAKVLSDKVHDALNIPRTPPKPVETLVEQILRERKTLPDCQKEREELQVKLEVTEDGSKRREASLAEKETILRKQTHDLRASKSRIDALEGELQACRDDDSKERIPDLTAELGRSRRDRETVRASAQRNLESMRSELLTAQAETARERLVLSQREKEIATLLRDSTLEREMAEASKNDLRARLKACEEDARSQHDPGVIESLRQELRSRETEIEDLKKTHDALTETLAKTQAEKEAFEQRDAESAARQEALASAQQRVDALSRREREGREELLRKVLQAVKGGAEAKLAKKHLDKHMRTRARQGAVYRTRGDLNAAVGRYVRDQGGSHVTIFGPDSLEDELRGLPVYLVCPSNNVPPQDWKDRKVLFVSKEGLRSNALKALREERGRTEVDFLLTENDQRKLPEGGLRALRDIAARSRG